MSRSLSPTSARRPRWVAPSTWTLRAKLVASMVALFAVITLFTGAATVFALNSFLTGQTDEQLARYFDRPPPDTGNPPANAGRQRGPGIEGLRLTLRPGLGVRDNFVTDSTGAPAALTQSQVATLLGAALGRQPRNIDLGGTAGTYRVVAGLSQQGDTVIVGLPLGPQQHTVGRMVAFVLTSAALGLLAVGVGGTWLVRRSLIPLRRVAATATHVSQLPLASGQVALAERVPAADTDARTEVGQVGAALNEMLDHVIDALNARHQSEQRVRQFVADASHELRTPLASIRGYAELTRREQDPVPPRVSHALARVESEAIRMSSLVDDLLLLARLDAGRPLDRVPVDLSEMVVNAVSDAHAAAPDHRWELDVPAEAVEVRGDPARLHQIVANLLANARTHTAAGTTVRTRITPEGRQVRLTVSDDGPGVPESLQHNVFQRFARGDGSRNRAAGSTGLGLSIVAAVVQAHGGAVELESSPGNTTFSVVLPVGAS